MKKGLVVLVFFFFIFGVFQKVLAVDCSTQRCASCDPCGYCLGGEVPESWSACRSCLFPGLTAFSAQSNKTLEIHPVLNSPPTPYPGRMYTMIGCVSTNFSSLEGGGATSFTKTILNLVFSTAGGIAFLYLIYGSFLILTSQSNPEKLDRGKKVVYGAIVGVIFALCSIFIINLVAANILRIPGFQTH